ncbi:MAG: ADP-ribosylglycohydrolase family protein [Bacteroidales bacterium]|nr:ADP-ribosylglycohydrolase family protein [Bacteroidales bacterium]
MLGAIIGDIAGSSQEFDNLMTYGFGMFQPYDSYTDDTICTVATADAILKDEPYGDATRRWCRAYPAPMGAYGSMFAEWIFKDDAKPYGSWGNGSAMRVSPVGHAFKTDDEIIGQATASAAFSHNHPEGIKGAVAVALAVRRLLDHKGKEGAEQIVRQYYGDGWADMPPQRGGFLADCMRSVPLAFRHLLDSTSFEDALRRTIAYGGDTDTMSAIVGAMAEPLWGIPAWMEAKARTYLPDRMLQVLDAFTNKYPSTIIY